MNALDRGGRPADGASTEQTTISPETASSDEDGQQQIATGTNHEADTGEHPTSADGFDSVGEADAQFVADDEESSVQHS